MGGGGAGRLFEAGRLLTFSTFRMGAYSRWALIRINTVTLQDINTTPEELRLVSADSSFSLLDPELLTPIESHHTTCLLESKSPSVKLMSHS